MAKHSTTQHTIPYQLRHHKAIDRNLFISLLRKLDRHIGINISEYRYVGFGAPFLEDFKSMHLEFGITKMDCIECNENAYSRQKFNNPYSFVNLHKKNCSDYLSEDFKFDLPQIIWLDFASPSEFAQQLLDLELLGEKINSYDVIRFTFNASISAYAKPNKNNQSIDFKKVLDIFKNDPGLQNYFPDHFEAKHIVSDFSILLRAMGIRAIKRGMATAGKDIQFNHISSFTYRDGQMMTTLTGIAASQELFNNINTECNFTNWPFFQSDSHDEIVPSNHILVPSMTIAERIAIDKLIISNTSKKIAEEIIFKYGSDPDEHSELIDGYCKYYKFLPYFSKITF